MTVDASTRIFNKYTIMVCDPSFDCSSLRYNTAGLVCKLVLQSEIAVVVGRAMAMAMGAWTALAVVVATVAILRVLHGIIWEPLRLLRIMNKQGVHGPPFLPVVGNIHEFEAYRSSLPEILPFDYSNHSGVAPQHALYGPKYGNLLDIYLAFYLAMIDGLQNCVS